MFYLKPTEETKFIQVLYDAVIAENTRNGPTIETTKLISDLKRRLSDAYRLLHTATWNDIITKLDIKEDSTKLWKTVRSLVRRLTGNNKQAIPYIRDDQVIKL